MLHQLNRRFTLLLFFFFFGIVFLYAQPEEIIIFDDQIDYYEDASRSLLKEDAFTLFENGGFIKSQIKGPLNFGYNDNPFWFHFNFDVIHAGDRVLSIPSAYHQYIDLHINYGEGWEKYSTGNLRNFDTRGELEPVNFAWKFRFKAGQHVEVITRVQSRAPVIFSAELKTVPRYHTDSLKADLFYGLYLGALLIMFLLNLAIFFTLTRKVYLYYLLIILTNLVVFSTVAGYSFKYLYPDAPTINLYIREMGIAFLMVPTSLFAIHFLNLKKYSRFFYYLMYIMLSVGLINCLVILSGTSYGYGMSSKLISVHAPLLLVAGIVSWRNGNETAPIYILAWTGYLLGGMLMTLRNAGVLPANVYTDHGAEVGALLDVFLLALALALRYKTTLKEKESLQDENINLVENQNVELESKVKIRTKELNNTINIVSKQHSDLQNKSREIAASIDYARKIQNAILPSRERLMKYFEDVVIFYLPKEKVSGDFFFFEKVKDLLIVGVADCTGHGVPGAMMSMLGYSLLYDAVKVEELIEPNEILNYLDKNIEIRLNQEDRDVKDGMDISICVIDIKTQKAQFSGAQRPILLCSNETDAQLIKGSKRTVGGHMQSIAKEYAVYDFSINKGDTLYLYSDGFQDQFGGENNKKFMSSRLREFLASIAHESGRRQFELIRDEFHNWKGRSEQIDDVIVLGLKF